MTTSAATYYVGPDGQPDKYRLLQQVGGGGEAQLWQADLPVAGGEEPVAVKVLRAERTGEFARFSLRWAEQAELLRFVRHPGVVGVREHFEGPPLHLGGTAGDSGGRSLYLVMNWVEGVPLREWTMQMGDAPDRLRLTLRHLEQAADVLDWLHSGDATPSHRPVVHGDLSPGNLMITPTGQAMLVDFGLMRVAAHQTREAAGTPGYAAPEVWAEGRYSPESDRYGFGALAFYALTGRNPPQQHADLAAGLASVPQIAQAGPQALGDLMTIFSQHPAERPTASVWMRTLRNAATTTQSNGAPPPHWFTAPTTVTPPAAPATQVSPMPSAPPSRPRWGRRIGWGAAALVTALVTVLGAGVVLGTRLTSSPPTPAGTATPTAAAVTAPPTSGTGGDPTTSSTASAGETGSTAATLDPASVRVRNSGATNPIQLSSGYYVDLDSAATNWDVNSDYRGDVQANGSTLILHDADAAPVPAGSDYRTCEGATEYQTQIDATRIDLPASYCVRTSQHRYALLTLQRATDAGVVFSVTVWDPPFRDA